MMKLRYILLLLLSLCIGGNLWASQADSTAVAGKYIFVPDSLQDDVVRLLDGHSKVVDDINHLDPEEVATFRGDTVPMVLKSINLGRHDRGLFNFLFLPKKIWQFGATASYGEIGTKDLDVLGLMSDVNISGKIFSINPYVSYFFRNNMAIGLKLGYYNATGMLDSFKMDIMDDLGLNLSDIRYHSNSYSAALTFTQYFGLARRGRFAVFNEVELAFKGGNSEFRRPFNGEPRETSTQSFELGLNFSPGLQVMVMKNVGFHISFGVFGLYLKNEKQKENNVEIGNRFTSGANFRFNIFNINFGIAVNI